MCGSSRALASSERRTLTRSGWMFIDVGAHLTRAKIAAICASVTGRSVKALAERASLNGRLCAWSSRTRSRDESQDEVMSIISVGPPLRMPDGRCDLSHRPGRSEVPGPGGGGPHDQQTADESVRMD